MVTILIILHIIICVSLILSILLQSGKGADLGAAFGGGSSQTIFGSTGAAPFLNKVTTGIAVAFMVTSLILAFLATRSHKASIMDAKGKAQQERAIPASDQEGPSGDEGGPTGENR